MKKNYSLIILLIFSFLENAQVLKIELQTPQTVSVNRLPMRANPHAFETTVLQETKKLSLVELFNNSKIAPTFS